MKKIIKEDERSTVIVEGDKVIKTYAKRRSNLNKEWLRHYKAFYKMYGGVVEVHDVDDKHIVMDFVEGIPMVDVFSEQKVFNHKLAYAAFAEILLNLSNMSEYSSMIGRTWFHNDASIYNHIYSNGKFILVDPDGFKLAGNVYPGDFISHLHLLTNNLRWMNSDGY